MTAIVDALFEKASIITSFIFVAVFFGAAIHNRWTHRKNDLGTLATRGMTASVAHPGLLLIICAFDSSRLSQLDALHFYLAVSGTFLIFIAYVYGLLPITDPENRDAETLD